MKKCISMLLALLMMLTMVPTAFAESSYSQPCVVDYFNSFNGYTKYSGTPGAPVGLESFLYQSNSKNLSTETDSDGTNTYLKMSGASSVAITKRFDETIRTGKLRLSFDMKIENPENLYRFYVYGHDNRKNDNPLDLCYQYEVKQEKKDEEGNPIKDEKGNPIMETVTKTDYAYSNLFDIGITDKTSQNLMIRADSDQKINTAEKIKNAWHKYDLEIDFDKNPYQIRLTIDGGNPLKSTIRNGLKSIYFFWTPGTKENAGKNSPVYMDNLFIKHYPSGTYDGTEMAVDYSGSGVANKSAVVDVAFSEASGVVNDNSDPFPNDFAAQNVVNNSVIEPQNAIKNNGNIRLSFADIPTGTYRIVCKKHNDYKGLFTNAEPNTSNTFSTAAVPQNVKEKNILVQDDFENYTGGIPANAEGFGGTKNHTVGALSATEGYGGTALNIKDKSQGVIYQFPYALTGDRFTYEFDLKHADGRWYTGILSEDAFSGKKSISAKMYETAVGKVGAEKAGEPTAAQYSQDMMDYKNQVHAIGNAGCGDAAANVQYVKTKQSWVDAAISGLTCPTNQWNHVKVEVDLNAATYTVTIDDVTKTVVLNKDRFRPQHRLMKKTVNGVEKWVKTWDYGINGILLGAYNDKGGAATIDVSYDNLVVYTDNSYNAYQDFNTQGRTDGIPVSAPGWIMQYFPNDSDTTTITGEGRDAETNTNDKSVKIAKLHSQPYAYQFNRPVSASTPFEMEFDIKGDSTNTKNELNFRLLTKEQLYSMYENTSTGSKVAESFLNHDFTNNNNPNRENGICTKEANYYNSGVIFAAEQETKDGNGLDNLRLAKGNGLQTWADRAKPLETAEKPDIPIDLTKWNHIKVSAYPKDGKLAYVLTLTDQNDNTLISTENETALPSTTEFAAFGISPVVEKSATHIVYMDNFIVKETDPVSNVYVTGVNAVDKAGGETAALTGGLKQKGQKIEISFSAPISEDTISKIKIYQGNPVKYLNTTAVLSADKKTVTLTPTSVPEVGEKYMLEVPNSVKADTASNLSTVEAKAVAFEIKESDTAAEIKVTDFRLYKYYPAGKNESVAYAERWVPVAESELKNLTANDRFKFVAKGYNTGDSVPLWLGRAEKDQTSNLLTSFDNQSVPAPYGEFELSLPEFKLEDANGSLEAFLWNNDGLRPLCGKYVLSVTKTPTSGAAE